MTDQKTMTDGELFEKRLAFARDAGAKLREQGGFSVDSRGGCVYRSSNGNKCAIGFYIPEEQYDLYFDSDSLGVPHLPERALPQEIWDLREEFLRWVQINLHDNRADGDKRLLSDTEIVNLVTSEWSPAGQER